MSNMNTATKKVKIKRRKSKQLTAKESTAKDFIPKEFMNRNNTIYKIDCQCLCEIENQISEI